MGIETRNISQGWLTPVLTPRSTFSPHTLYENGQLTHDPSYMSSETSAESLAPAFTEKSTIKGMTTLRTTHMLQHLGYQAIYSRSPYVDNALESLLVEARPPGG